MTLRALSKAVFQKSLINKSGRLIIFSLLLFFTSGLWAQGMAVERVDPPFWWTGMKNSQLQLMVKGKGLKGCDVSLNYPGVNFSQVTFADNPAYVFIDFNISSDAEAGVLNIRFSKKETEILMPYTLKQKRKEINEGVDAGDFIYLLIPDRFANGDPSNDVVQGMNESICNRDSAIGRHGGDLQGVIQNLDYLENLGVTALWLNPVLENNQPFASYHGYAVTDHYRVDPRLGSIEKYTELIDKCYRKDIKVIMDINRKKASDILQKYLNEDS